MEYYNFKNIRIQKGLSQKDLAAAIGVTTYNFDTDYTINFNDGKIMRTAAGALSSVEGVKVSYDYSVTTTTNNNVADITVSDIVGSTNAQGERSGAQLLLDVFGLFGFNPKILLAPGFSNNAAVRTALDTIADKVRAIVLADLPTGVTVTEAIQARGSQGSFDLQTTSDRVYLLYPYLKHYDYATEQDQLMPYSASMAGLIAQTDRDFGYWYSPSNHDLTGVTGLERKIVGSYTEPNCELQLLNEKGITSVINSYGSGYKAFGNRMASYAGTGGLETFISSRRVSDMICESLEQTMARYVDLPLSAAIIDDIISVGNSFIKTLMTRGALIGGECKASPTENTPETLSQGQLVIVYEYTPPAPLERITNKIILSTKFLS